MISYAPKIDRVTYQGLSIDVLRLDEIHPEISGNKWFKLKHNIENAQSAGIGTLLTFGGAHSNHLLATAAAGQMAGINTVGIVRGWLQESETLTKCRSFGMRIKVVDRDAYQRKNSPDCATLMEHEFGRVYIIPEGGNNEAGIKGASEIWDASWNYDYAIVAVGTGTSYAGLVSVCRGTKLVGVNVLKGQNEIVRDVRLALNRTGSLVEVYGNEMLGSSPVKNHFITDRYSLGGYAAFEPRLIAFKNSFERSTGIPLDHIYTVKSFFAAFDLAAIGAIAGRILIIHTGGLQGNTAFERRWARSLS